MITQEERLSFFERRDVRIILIKLRRGIVINVNEYELCKNNIKYFKDFVFTKTRKAKPSAFKPRARIENEPDYKKQVI